MSKDVFSYSTNEAADIIANVDISSEFLQIPSNEYRTREFERDSRHLINLELHCATIAEYLKAERIPQGLRVALRPTIFKENDDFCKKFEQILNKCSFDLMTLTLDTLQKSITSVREKVQSTEIQLSTSMTSDGFQSFKTKLTSTLSQHRQDSEQKKRLKFLRNAEDYRNNRVYRWKDSFSTGSYRPRRTPSDSTYSSSDNEKFSNRRGPFLNRKKRQSPRRRQGGADNGQGMSSTTVQTRSQALSPPQMSLLQKGLSFCPSYKLDTFQLDMDLQKFYRSLRLKVFFNKTDNINTSISSPLVSSPVNLQQLGIKTRSNFMPPKNDHPIETFIELIDREVELFKQDVARGKLHCPVNMTSLEQQALHSLIKDKELVVKPTDKGGAIVVMDQRDYLAEIHRQLADRTIYEPLSHNPASSIATKIHNTIEPYLLNKTIDKRVYDFLVNQFPITPVFYVLPKVHKRLDKPPGRPIVASTDSVLSPLSILLEKILTPMVRLTKSFILDTGDFIKLIKDIGQVPCDSILVTWDVNSLYTSIIHEKGLTAVQELLNGSSLDGNTIRFCMELLNLVLREKFFMFGK
ncbi:unnamed protein product [Ranitomeya imitator]|uniref:Reverse transcriptase domain-containing protein n=1 Tax=Ranitomeya imitator TaxID=111125 RepID=A0ABN9M068_9NEOB|nr:unnamed protein product [Ranitomeya imitator]